MKRLSFEMILYIVLTVLWILYWVLEGSSSGKIGEGILYALEPPGVLWGLWFLGRVSKKDQKNENKTLDDIGVGS